MKYLTHLLVLLGLVALVAACTPSRGGGGGSDDDDAAADDDDDATDDDDAAGDLCTDSCGPEGKPGGWAGDGACDDGGEGSEFSVCDFGTDCTDCGPRDPGDAPE